MAEEDTATTPPVYVNEDTPPDLEIKANPDRVAVGHLGDDTSMEQVASALVEAGIPEDRIHFLDGDDGIAFLDDLGNWFSRAMSESWKNARDHLDEGRTIVGVFEVDEEDAGLVRSTLEDAGIEHASYYGKWSNLE
jgi:hypothetical protein